LFLITATHADLLRTPDSLGAKSETGSDLQQQCSPEIIEGAKWYLSHED
jgi:hypothetical protein